MADPTSQQPRHSKILRYIAIALLVLIVLVGLAVLITWLIIKPGRFVYTVEEGSIKNFNFTKNQLNATFEFALRSPSPTSKISIYYDSIDASVQYDDQTIAFEMDDPSFNLIET
ncbi:hypothetical protein ACB092_08G133500 [Castanea dentata]